jgi:hypothetical protein
LLLDVAATEQGRAHVITDGLVGEEQKMMPLLGFLAKSRREAEFPTEILLSPGWVEMLLMVLCWACCYWVGVLKYFQKKSLTKSNTLTFGTKHFLWEMVEYFELFPSRFLIL